MVIGDMAMRLRSVTPLRVKGLNRSGIGGPAWREGLPLTLAEPGGAAIGAGQHQLPHQAMADPPGKPHNRGEMTSTADKAGLVFITDEVPRPGEAGHLAVNHEIISFFAARGHPVTVLLTRPRLPWP